MKIFDGKKEAEKIIADLKKKISKQGISPKLAIISIAPDDSSKLYMRNKRRAAKRAGIKIASYFFSAKAKEASVLNRIEKLNQDKSIFGIIVQLPLPAVFNTDKIINSISFKKDVDGFQKQSFFEAVLPQAIYFCLKKAGVKKNQHLLALVNSKIFGETLKLFLKKKNLEMQYFFLKKMPLEKIKKTEVLITACGCPGIINGVMIKDGVIVIDAGITKKGKKILGDADRESVPKKANFLTPVPGGIGPLTVALLLKNTYLAYGNSKNN